MDKINVKSMIVTNLVSLIVFGTYFTLFDKGGNIISLLGTISTAPIRTVILAAAALFVLTAIMLISSTLLLINAWFMKQFSSIFKGFYNSYLMKHSEWIEEMDAISSSILIAYTVIIVIGITVKIF